MARFYASIQGNRGEATRQGSPESGIHGHIRGWHCGVDVEGYADGDADVFDVYATGGSNGRVPARRIATVRRGPDGLDVEFHDKGKAGNR